MKQTYFKIDYEFDREEALNAIDRRVREGGKGYVVVADGVILNNVSRHPDYLAAVNGSMFSICDSSYVPVYIRWIYGRKVSQYCGSSIFGDITGMGKYRMAFLGSDRKTLDALRERLSLTRPEVRDMLFYELPFRNVEDFDYEGIAGMLDGYGADIIWVSLGAPKQEFFMNRLLPHLGRGVMIAVGAAFKFYSGQGERRAPDWMLRHHLEFVWRICQDPGKQLKRCAWIVVTLPGLLCGEWRRKRKRYSQKMTHRRKLD